MNRIVQNLKVKVFISMHEPLEVTKCKKCGKVMAEPKELIMIQSNARAVPGMHRDCVENVR